MYQRYVKAEGDSRERGREIGRQLRMQIETNYANQTAYYRETEGYDYAQWGRMAEGYVPLMRQYTPQVLEELEGMAEGAGLPMGQLLSLTAAYEKSFSCERLGDKCSAFAAAGKMTADGRAICGQTNDESYKEWVGQLDVVLHHVQPDTGRETLLYTHPGVPAYMGMNNRGLAVLWTYIDNGQIGKGVPTNAIIRALLELDGLAQAEEFLRTVPHAVPNFFLVTHRSQGILEAECFPNQVYVRKNDSRAIHTNHTVFGEEPEATASWSTCQRLERLTELVEENAGRITAELAMDFFRSHKGFPHSLCVHPNPNKTVGVTFSAMVYDLGAGEMHITFGNPCENPYHCYRFDRYPVKVSSQEK